MNFDSMIKESAALIVAAYPDSVSPIAIHTTLRFKAKECDEAFDMEVAYEKVCIVLESENVDVEA